MKRDLNILLIEDDTIMGESLMERFELEDFQAQWAHSGAEGRKWLARGGFGLVLSDLHLPDMGGDALFREAAANSPALPPWLFITGYGAVDQAVELLKLGAADYLTKPFDLDALVAKLRLYALAAPPAHAVVDPGLGISPALRRIEAQLPQLATQARTVLITGESGVGKEVVARAFHRLAPEGDNAPFIAVNCGAFPEGLLEAELFGHEKGAFTGAVRTRKGVFEQADGGTLFLDEVGDMSLKTQAKILRIIQEQAFERVGGARTIRVDARIVAATNKDLQALIDRGEFRQDLYFRLNVIPMHVPPLRERSEDIALLVDDFLGNFARESTIGRKTLDPEVLPYLLRHKWPGNVRELKNFVERLVIMSPHPVITVADLPKDFTGQLEGAPPDDDDPYQVPNLKEARLIFERQHLKRRLAECDGNISLTAARVGLERSHLHRKLKTLGIRVNDEN